MIGDSHSDMEFGKKSGMFTILISKNPKHNSTVLIAIGNDYSFDRIFSKQIEGIGKKGDIAIGISTSGNSRNVVEAINIAKEKKLFTIGFTGRSGGGANKRNC